MERHAFELFRNLSELTEVKLIKWGGSNKWLPLIIPYLLFRSLWALSTSNIRVIYLHDGLLSPLGLIFRLFRKPIIITIHGRDIAYENALYQFIIPKCLARLSKVICVSNAIKEACITRGVIAKNTVVIANGISDEFFTKTDNRSIKTRLPDLLERDLNDNKIIISMGRLVEKKGIHWFVAEVMPHLTDNGYIYIIAGTGILEPEIQKSIKEKGLDNKVFLVGWANDEMLRLLYNVADIFVMPNIPVKGDMEGFGLVALEASSCGLPVVASNLEGIQEAIKDGKNGFLVRPGDVSGYVAKIKDLLSDDELRKSFGAEARKYTIENYGWEKMAQRYLEEFVELESRNRKPG